MNSSATPKSPQHAPSIAVWSWILYDFASTIFSVSILSYFFPLWLGDELGAGANLFNYITAASMVLVALTAPAFGAVADLRQRRRIYLIVFTILAIVSTAGLSFSGTVVAAAALFIAANFAYQSAQVFYNALLPSVSPERGTGRVSGYGVAAGYVGTIFALLLITPFVTSPNEIQSLLGTLGGWIRTTSALNSNAFLPTAALYLLFSLPSFFFVSDQRIHAPLPLSLEAIYRGVHSTISNARTYPGLGPFLLSTILYTDAASTTVVNMSLYGREVFAMEQSEIRNLLLFSTVFAAVGATGFGFITDHLGPKRTLFIILITWLAAILLAAVAATPWMLLLAGPVVGIALGATWTVSRAMLVALSPAEKLGEFFGFYALAGRLSAVTGPLITAILLTIFEDLGSTGYRLAVAALALMVVLALILLLRVPDVRP
ncbi:MAG: MFS transporter [Rubrobacter sp.]|nr:MFS transporter [Rubrobacter sp.]